MDLPTTSSLSTRKSFRFLLHSFYATGHALPMQAVARALVEHGHEVVWISSAAQEDRVLASGSKFIATQEIAIVDTNLKIAKPTNMVEIVDALLEGRVIAQVKDFRRVIGDTTLLSGPIDCLLIDALPQGAAALFDLGEAPLWATLGVVPMYLAQDPNSEETDIHAPISPLGTLMSNPELILPCINSQRTRLGLKALELSPETVSTLQYSPFLHLQASCAMLEFEDKAEDRTRSALLPPQLHYIGPLVTPTGKRAKPAFWDKLPDPSANSHIIFITQGTFATDFNLLIIPAIEALANNVTLTLVVASHCADEIRKSVKVEDNVHIADWVPYDLILPRCRLLITNGGYGSITQALAEGVPTINAGTTEDKLDTAARVTFIGAGVDLKTDTPSLEQIQNAVKLILENPSYKENAMRAAQQLKGLGGAEKACSLLEQAVEKSIREEPR